MHLPGHLAVALLQHRLLTAYAPRRLVTTPLFIASLFPDVVDKMIGYIFGWMPNGRHYSHNLFSLALLSAAVGLMWGKMAGVAWFTGHLGHLLADSSSFVPWFFPFKQYTFYKGQLRLKPYRLLKEGLFLILEIFLLRWIESRRGRKKQGQI